MDKDIIWSKSLSGSTSKQDKNINLLCLKLIDAIKNQNVTKFRYSQSEMGSDNEWVLTLNKTTK